MRHAVVCLVCLGWLVIACLPLPAGAQASNEFANCTEVTDPDVQLQMDLCRAHAGCRLVLGVQKACTKVRSMLDGLRNSIGEGVQTLFGTRKEVRDEDVWNAVQTPNTRRIDDLPATREASNALRGQLRQQPAGRLQDGQLPDGRRYVHSGTVRDGQADGLGVRYFSDGSIQRGPWRAGQLDGEAEQLGPSSNGELFRRIGRFEGGQFREGTVAHVSGNLDRGRFIDNRIAEGTRTRPDGSRDEGRFEGFQLAEGSRYGADGTLLERGRFRAGQLQDGERWRGGQLVERIDRTRDALQLAESQQQAGMDRQRREAEQRTEATRLERERAAAAEAAFRAQLEQANPGQLLALADELQEKGEAGRAREALRSLVRRFPDSPLAAQAVQQMAPAPSVAAAAATRTAPAAAAARAGSGSDSCRRALSAAFDKAMARGASEKVSYAPGVSGRFEIRSYELGMQFLAPCRGEADTDREIDNYRRGIEQLKGFCTPERLARDYPRRDGAGGYQVPDHCSKEYVSPAVERWYTIFREEVAAARQQLAGGALPASSGCEPDAGLMAAYDAAMAALPGGSPSVQIRGAIVGIDLQLRAARACQAGASRVAALEQQREQALRTCRQIVSRDNCLEPPFALPGPR